MPRARRHSRLTLAAGLVMALAAGSARAGARVVEPDTGRVRTGVHGFEVGPWMAIAVPTNAASKTFDDGFRAGVTTTFLQTHATGVGLDVSHVGFSSTRAGAALDELFSALTGTLVGAPR